MINGGMGCGAGRKPDGKSIVLYKCIFLISVASSNIQGGQGEGRAAGRSCCRARGVKKPARGGHRFAIRQVWNAPTYAVPRRIGWLRSDLVRRECAMRDCLSCVNPITSRNELCLRAFATGKAALKTIQQCSTLISPSEHFLYLCSYLWQAWMSRFGNSNLNPCKQTPGSRQFDGEGWRNRNEISSISCSQDRRMKNIIAGLLPDLCAAPFSHIGLHVIECIAEAGDAVSDLHLKSCRAYDCNGAFASLPAPCLDSCNTNRHDQSCQCTDNAEPCCPIASFRRLPIIFREQRNQ